MEGRGSEGLSVHYLRQVREQPLEHSLEASVGVLAVPYWVKRPLPKFIKKWRKQVVPGTFKEKGQKGNSEWALGDGKARGSEGVG